MKLSISNIAWTAEEDETVYRLMQGCGFTGLEIAPTRIFPENPYDCLKEAAVWSRGLHEKYGFRISSMQSIWYGRTERIFCSGAERRSLLAYTKKAIDFAGAAGCGNLVLGCPKNRNIPEGMPAEEAERTAVSFFREAGEYAFEHGTVLSLEANPPIYHTNFINDTESAIRLIKKVDSRGFLLNLDTGTMIQNGEGADVLAGNLRLINHVHISEPGLAMLRERKLHREIMALLKKDDYKNFVSVEMGKKEFAELKKAMVYMAEAVQ